MNILSMLNGDITEEDLLNYYNIEILIKKMSKNIREFSFSHDNINFVVLNENLSYQRRKETLLHELAHIELNQFNQVDSDLISLKVKDYEDEANRYIEFINEVIRSKGNEENGK